MFNNLGSRMRQRLHQVSIIISSDVQWISRSLNRGRVLAKGRIARYRPELAVHLRNKDGL
jgi:hypothetical protein